MATSKARTTLASSPSHPTVDQSASSASSAHTSSLVDENTPRRPSLHWNANSYFAPGSSGEGSAPFAPQSPEEATKGAKSRKDILRRLSLVDTGRPQVSEAVTPGTYPELKLTGNIISATVCIPYNVGYCTNSGWDLRARRGTSALFDSFIYLSSEKTPWNHTLVGWTGEIEPVYQPPANLIATESMSSSLSNISRHGEDQRLSLSAPKASVPPPVHKPQTRQYNARVDGLSIPQDARQQLETRLVNDHNGRILPVWLSDGSADSPTDIFVKDQSRWRRYAEHELYTLFHYKQHAPDDGRAEHKWWKDYVRMNELFAERIVDAYKPGDLIWIHDYHLMLLPNMLRQRLPKAYIGFFLHIPFPSSELLRCLPRRKAILEGCLGATIVVFQSFGYSRHFTSCCTRILGFDSNNAGVDAYGARVAVDALPIGIDAAGVQKAAFADPIVDENVEGIKKMYAGKKIIVGRDRLDSVRGVSQKLQAFAKFLEKYPEWRDQVVLIQVTSPTSVEEEKEDPQHHIGNKVSELVSEINGQYGSLSFSPVLHYPQYLSQQEYFALLRISDIGLITSVRDGMNTTSHEYIICQRDSHGPLILSEFSGTAGSLSQAILINPWDLSGVAKEIHEALTMNAARRKVLHSKLYDHVKTHTVSAWVNKFLNRLFTNLASQGDMTPVLDTAKMLSYHHVSKKRLFMFDYDGTLTPIVKDPQAAIPSDKVLRSLKTLAADPANVVWIISGRDQGFLDEWMKSIPELGLSAEHGSFIRRPRNERWENLTETMDMSWQDRVMEVFQYYTEKTQGSVIERKRVALTWHYRRADPDYGAFQARACREHLMKTVEREFEVEVMAGKANLEVRPKFVNKGFIATRLVKECGGSLEFILCCGDDFTDEGKQPNSVPQNSR